MLNVPNPLLILAMDHRAVMRGLFGDGLTPEQQTERFGHAKDLAFRALLEVADAGLVQPANTGVLIDDQYGSAVIPKVKDAGYTLILPVEASRSPKFDIRTGEFILEHGDDFGDHLPLGTVDMVKALIVHNPALEEDRRRRQVERAATVSKWAIDNGVPFMLELLCPPTAEQLEEAGDLDTYRRTAHADLVCRSIDEYQAGGVWPSVWKLEPLASDDDYRRVSAQCLGGAPHETSLILLGGGADLDQVETWLREINGVPGFIGFAIGRSLWQNEFRELFAGRATDEETVAGIRANIERVVGAYTGAAAK
ncbi:DUF2090 domain-containing protein [Actinoplanes bogorensis]|uniref:DUF2090 domain-containing protein n=1 Tax=Paractinoplanes bogorensis TaxID=1610840 RepID=A0ABS5YZL9_9ACTN|nr:DUF2090 domain-containing protein [Actinoplanes bogorensis]MBU2668891.1 DUF2090 domain-containing protein [Actinoplanes bogorensis]